MFQVVNDVPLPIKDEEAQLSDAMRSCLVGSSFEMPLALKGAAKKIAKLIGIKITIIPNVPQAGQPAALYAPPTARVWRVDGDKVKAAEPAPVEAAMAAFRANPDGISLQQMNKLAPFNTMTKKSRDELLAVLQERDLVESVIVNTNGRPRTVYVVKKS